MTKILKNITRSEANNIISEMNRASYKFKYLSRDREDVFISIPDYLSNILFNDYTLGYEYAKDFEFFSSLKVRFADCKIIPASDNKITIFLKAAPLYGHLEPVIIDLDKSQK